MYCLPSLGKLVEERAMSETPEFYERVKRLYSAVEDFDALPRGWNKDKTVQHINLSHNNLRVHYKGAEKLGKEAAAVRTHVPILSACGIYYFEVKIISKGRDGKSNGSPHHLCNQRA